MWVLRLHPLKITDLIHVTNVDFEWMEMIPPVAKPPQNPTDAKIVSGGSSSAPLRLCFWQRSCTARMQVARNKPAYA